MNRSGKAVSKALSVSGDSLSECMICYDDIHLESGRIRIRPSGSAGGHNGLSDIVNQLQSKEIPRLRIGIGNDFARGRQAEYVLEPFTSAQRKKIDEALEVASEAILTFIRGDIEKAMNQFN